MFMIEAVIRPNKLEAVKTALLKRDIVGATAVECMGFGKQLGHSPRYRGPKLDAGFVPKILVKICVKQEDKDRAIEAVLEAARSGEVGDGKIFVYPVAQTIRIRTGEAGPQAL